MISDTSEIEKLIKDLLNVCSKEKISFNGLVKMIKQQCPEQMRETQTADEIFDLLKKLGKAKDIRSSYGLEKWKSLTLWEKISMYRSSTRNQTTLWIPNLDLAAPETQEAFVKVLSSYRSNYGKTLLNLIEDVESEYQFWERILDEYCGSCLNLLLMVKHHKKVWKEFKQKQQNAEKVESTNTQQKLKQRQKNEVEEEDFSFIFCEQPELNLVKEHFDSFKEKSDPFQQKKTHTDEVKDQLENEGDQINNSSTSFLSVSHFPEMCKANLDLDIQAFKTQVCVENERSKYALIFQAYATYEMASSQKSVVSGPISDNANPNPEFDQEQNIPNNLGDPDGFISYSNSESGSN